MFQAQCDLTCIIYTNPNHSETVLKDTTDLLYKIGGEMMVNDCECCTLLSSGTLETQHGTYQKSDEFQK